MDKLPTEIFNNIFSHLHQAEKVECMLVCRHWASFIRMSCLFNTVTILSNNYDSDTAIARFESLTKSLEQNPLLSNQVQHLLLKDCFDYDFDGSILGKQFPHLRFLFLSNTYVGQNQFTTAQLEQFKSWKNYLEQIIENETALFTLSLLDAGVFDCLKTICLKPDHESVPAPIEERHFKNLKNAPLLTTLKLESLSFPLEYMEVIHENAPTLKYLTLISIFLEDEVNLPKVISPANCMKTLCIQDCYLSLSMQYTWTSYITRKYTELTGFTFECDVNPVDVIPGTDFAHHLTTPLMRSLGQQLKLFHIESICLSPELFEAIDGNGYELQDIKLNRTASPLFLEKLFRSNQAQYIQSLTLIHLTDSENFDLLGNLTVLKSLNLDFGSKHNMLVDHLHKSPLYLNKLIKQSPRNLEELTISNTLIEIDTEFDEQPNQTNQLKTLNFTSAKIEDGVTNFIANTCPKLSIISLIKCATPVLEFSLPSHDLTCFEIVGHFVSSTFILTRAGETVHFSVPEDGNPTKYCYESFINENTRPFYSLCKPVPPNEVNLKLRTQLTCRSVRSLFINGQLVV
ncbi:hypothetical protein K501DRAFT_312407 [Backusella circina FSU 941]|nr:hypothetical protein K501DRAFT_312407 [Backusella circina FSU 941]